MPVGTPWKPHALHLESSWNPNGTARLKTYSELRHSRKHKSGDSFVDEISN